MKKMIVLWLVCFMAGCSSQELPKTITADETLEKMQQGAVLLDVREPAEYRQGHIENSINLSLQAVEKEIANIVSDKHSVIIVYCQSGNRSRQAAHMLADMGYTEVYDLGGIGSWPYAIVK